MKKILLIGASGFIGRNICESYLNDKYEIIAPSSNDMNLLDTQSVNDYMKQPFDVVIHTANVQGRKVTDNLGNIYFENKDVCYQNLKMFFNLISNPINKLIYIGSGSSYGIKKPKITENEGQVPQDEHGLYKYIVSKYIQEHDNMLDLRVFGIFGKYEDPMRFPTDSVNRCIEGRDIIIRENKKFDYLYINDLMPILEYFIENTPKHKVYNITPDESITLFELAQKIKNISNKDIDIKVLNQGFEYSGNNERIRKEIKLQFTPIDKALEELYGWQKKGNL